MKLGTIISSYKWQFALTTSLVLLDAALVVLFPLFIGFAIDDVMNQQYQGAVLLGGLGLVSLLIGAGRRWFDTRFYAKVYEQLGTEVGSRESVATSTKTAHLGLLNEVVEFFENSVPELINSIIGLVGTLVILATLDIRIFAGCLLILLVVMLVYGATEKKTLAYNASFNTELERQVDVIEGRYPIQLRRHLSLLMRWNIRLSDLETINFSIVWLVMMVFLVISIIGVVSEGVLQVGSVFAMILYLFQFIEDVSIMPFFYQQWLRLSEIMGRLGKSMQPGPRS